jgi:hypothetical protein
MARIVVPGCPHYVTARGIPGDQIGKFFRKLQGG